MNSSFDVNQLFHDAKIKKNDTVLIHGDAGVAAQIFTTDQSNKIKSLILKIINYFDDEGTIVVPTFSYSFTKNEIFNKKTTKSAVGLFSETFRKFPNVKRSNHPIFSFAAVGKYKYEIANSRIDDCFGKKTVFDFLHQHDAKIISLGCHFDQSATFVHFIEQCLGVSYRYKKTFSGFLENNNKRLKTLVSYNVRDLNIDSLPQMDLLKKISIKENCLFVGSMGRFPFYSISAKNYFRIAKELISINEYSLIGERFKTNS